MQNQNKNVKQTVNAIPTPTPTASIPSQIEKFRQNAQNQLLNQQQMQHKTTSKPKIKKQQPVKPIQQPLTVPMPNQQQPVAVSMQKPLTVPMPNQKIAQQGKKRTLAQQQQSAQSKKKKLEQKKLLTQQTEQSEAISNYMDQLDDNVVNNHATLIGTCTDLEKPYLRLTSVCLFNKV